MNGVKGAGVVFKCKYCQYIFLTAEQLISHKRAEHSSEILNRLAAADGNQTSNRLLSRRIPKPVRGADTSASSRTDSGYEGHTSNQNEPSCQPIIPDRHPTPSVSRGSTRKSRNDLEIHDITQYNITEEETFFCAYCDAKFNQVIEKCVHEKQCLMRNAQSPLNLLSSQDLDSINISRHSASSRSNENNSCSHLQKDRHESEESQFNLTTVDQSGNECRFCGKRFMLQIQVTVHERTHTGERSYACKFCRVRFANTSSVEHHEKICPVRQTVSPTKTGSPLREVNDLIPASTRVVNDRETQLAPSTNPSSKDNISANLHDHTSDTDHPPKCTCQACLPKNQESTSGTQPDENMGFSCSHCGQGFVSRSGANFHESLCPVKHVRVFPIPTPKHTNNVNKDSEKAPLPVVPSVQNHFSAGSSSRKGNKTGFPCELCGKTFASRWALGRHKNSHSRQGLSTCRTCGVSFKNRLRLCHHKLIARYKSQTPTPASSNARTASPKSSLGSNNISPMESFGRYCRFCGKRFKYPYLTLKHERTHTGERPYTCDYCPARFARTDHQHKHHQVCPARMITSNLKEDSESRKQKAYSKRSSGKHCGFCGKVFKFPASRVAHERTHTGERPFPCGYCPARFKQPQHQKKHRRICSARSSLITFAHHPGLPEQDSNKLTDHSESTKRKPPLLENSTKLHPDGHTNASPYTCAKCGQTYNHPTTLHIHKRWCHRASSVVQQPPSTERISPVTASQPESTTVVAGGKQCGFCGKEFGNSYNKKIHERIHTGLRPYACDYCSKRFVQRCHRIRHHRICPTRMNACTTPLSQPDEKEAEIAKEDSESPEQSSVQNHSSLPPDGPYQVRVGQGCGPKSIPITTDSQLLPAVQHPPTEKSSQILPAVQSRPTEKFSQILHPPHRPETNSSHRHNSNQQKVNTGRELIPIDDRMKHAHIWQHAQVSWKNGKRFMACLLCPKTYVGYVQLIKDHVAVHLGLQPFECDLCPRRFNRPGLLRTHRLKHEEIRLKVSPPQPETPESTQRCSPDSGTTTCPSNESCKNRRESPAGKILDVPSPESAGKRVGAETSSPSTRSSPKGNNLEFSKPKKSTRQDNVKSGSKTRSVPYLPHLIRNVKTGSDDDSFYTCKECGKILKTDAAAVTHVRVHIGPKIYHCPHCIERFRRKSGVIQHVVAHSVKDNSSQSTPPEVVGREGTTVPVDVLGNAEVSLRNGLRMYRCNLCGKKFKRSSIVRRHKYYHHRRSDPAIRLTRSAKRIHQTASRHRGSTQPHPSAMQLRRISKRSSTREDAPVSSTVTPFVCHQCGDKFEWESALRDHLMNHTRGKPIGCRDCHLRFDDEDLRRRHGEGHLKKKPLMCLTCGEWFGWRDAFMEHVKEHEVWRSSASS